MTSVQHKSPTQQLRTALPKGLDTPTRSTCNCQPQTLNARLTARDRQTAACLSVSHTSTKRKRKRMREMTMMNSVRATVVPNVTEWSVYYDDLSDLTSFIYNLIWFSTECYVGRKWPTSVLNEYGLLWEDTLGAMEYVQGPMTTEIMAPTQTMDSLCPLSLLHLLPPRFAIADVCGRW